MQCPRCRLISPPSAMSCDCGYELRLPPEMQSSALRQPVREPSARRTVGLMLALAIAVAWAVYLLCCDSGNNLYGILMVVLVPASVILLAVAGILMISTFSTRD